MKQDWILDVLNDLKAFARDNGLPTLAEQLDDTAIVALSEISAAKDCQNANRSEDAGRVGTYLDGAGTRHGA